MLELDAIDVEGIATALADQTYYEEGFLAPGRWAVAGITYSF